MCQNLDFLCFRLNKFCILNVEERLNQINISFNHCHSSSMKDELLLQLLGLAVCYYSLSMSKSVKQTHPQFKCKDLCLFASHPICNFFKHEFGIVFS